MSYVIGTLDLESYSLKSNAAIAEVALVAYDIGTKKHYQNIPENLHEDPETRILRIGFPLLEQVMLGQDIDSGTLKFHAQNQGVHFLGNLLFRDLDTDPLDSYNSLTVIKSFIEKQKIKELWINHCNFDGPMLKVLAEKVQFKMWSHYLEYDLYPFRKVFDLKTSGDGNPMHRAIEDCFWNMKVIRSLGQFITEELKDPSVIRYESPVKEPTPDPEVATLVDPNIDHSVFFKDDVEVVAVNPEPVPDDLPTPTGDPAPLEEQQVEFEDSDLNVIVGEIFEELRPSSIVPQKGGTQ